MKRKFLFIFTTISLLIALGSGKLLAGQEVSAQPACTPVPGAECQAGTTEIPTTGNCCPDTYQFLAYNADPSRGAICYEWTSGGDPLERWVVFEGSTMGQLDVSKSDSVCWYTVSNAISVRLTMTPLWDLGPGYLRCPIDGDINFSNTSSKSVESYEHPSPPASSSGCPEDTCELENSDGELASCCPEGAERPSSVCAEFTATGDCVRFAPIVCTRGASGNMYWKNPSSGGAVDPSIPVVLSCDQVCEGEDPACGTCCSAGGTWTEVGCITATQSGVVAAVMRIFIGIVTAIAVLRFIQAGILFNTEDTEKIKEAKSIATSAVVALIIAGTLPVILNFALGMDVLGIGNIFG